MNKHVLILENCLMINHLMIDGNGLLIECLMCESIELSEPSEIVIFDCYYLDDFSLN